MEGQRHGQMDRIPNSEIERKRSKEEGQRTDLKDSGPPFVLDLMGDQGGYCMLCGLSNSFNLCEHSDGICEMRA